MRDLRPGDLVYYGTALPHPDDTTHDRGVVDRDGRRLVVRWMTGEIDMARQDGQIMGIPGWAIPVPAGDTMCCLPVLCRTVEAP